MLSRRLGDVFLLASLRLLVLPEDGFDRLQVATSGAGEKRPDDIRVGDVGQLSVLLQKPSNVLSQGFPWLLAAASEIPRVPRAHVRALEVSSEGLDQVVPVGDLRRRQML